MLFAPKEKGQVAVEVLIVLVAFVILVCLCIIATIGFCKFYVLMGIPGDC